jgi:hypothetical protein
MSTIRDAASSSQRFIQNHRAQINEARQHVQRGYKAATKVKDAAKAIPKAARDLRTDGFVQSTRTAWKDSVRNAQDNRDTLNRGGLLKKGNTAYSALTGAKKTYESGKKAFNDIRQAVRSGSREDIKKAADSSAQAARDGITTTKAALETARDVKKFGSSYRAANRAFADAVPGAAKGLARKVGVDAARAAFSDPNRAKTAASEAVSSFARKAGSSLADVSGTAGRSAARAVLRQGSNDAAKAATTAAARAAKGPIAKAAGRFVPGANVAIAAHDTYTAVKTIKDPNASLGKKITSGVTALGSIAAATNIPVVSQVGGAVSAVSSFVGGFFD